MKVFAVYLCGDELPSILFPYYNDTPQEKQAVREQAEKWTEQQPRWMDKEIKELLLVIELAAIIR